MDDESKIIVAILKDRINVLNELLNYPCNCEKSRMPEFFAHIRNILCDTEIKLEKYEN